MNVRVLSKANAPVAPHEGRGAFRLWFCVFQYAFCSGTCDATECVFSVYRWGKNGSLTGGKNASNWGKNRGLTGGKWQSKWGKSQNAHFPTIPSKTITNNFWDTYESFFQLWKASKTSISYTSWRFSQFRPNTEAYFFFFFLHFTASQTLNK